MTTYRLKFLEEALKEWGKIDSSVKEQFKKKLDERLEAPRIVSAKLIGHPDRYKIKLKSIGYRLVYEVKEDVLVVLVLAVGKREGNAVYRMANKR